MAELVGVENQMRDDTKKYVVQPAKNTDMRSGPYNVIAQNGEIVRNVKGAVITYRRLDGALTAAARLNIT